MAAIAGALNTAAFHAVGFFSANMTGNVSALSDRAATADWRASVFYLSIVLAFVVGASVSTLLINAGRRRRIRSVYAIGILSEALLMTTLGCTELLIGPHQKGPTLILGLSFLMGIQNAVVTHISDARVRTTHVSGMSTDIGIELSMLLDIALGREPTEQAAPYRMKLRLHTQTVLSFLAGGVVGVILYQSIGNQLLFAAAAVLFAIAGSAIIRAHTQENRVSST
ncbi:YoaK family protein [Dyella sp.]|uniref:YoaK family protein n=1 Tax=Dyella sp. TaxID=1869338 RepID=UPI00284244DE|nr:YoaK family protein [Dyella sp.]MDR3446681.1 YoaK family protein [Dyella sp.]